MDIIKSSSDISALFKRGRRLSTPFITLIVMRTDKQHGLNGRVAFIAGKKLGNAVWRNRAKRRMRSICRDLGGPFSAYDVIFLAKPRINSGSYDEILASCKKRLDQAGIRTD